MEEWIDNLGDGKYQSKLDCNLGYCKIALKNTDNDNTKCVWHSESYTCNRMKFVLTNAPSNFQISPYIVLAAGIWKTCVVYLDDIIIFSKDMESNFQHVEEILSALGKANITIMLKKCELLTKLVRYLGHIIEPDKL